MWLVSLALLMAQVIAAKTRVAIIGAGASGCACAKALGSIKSIEVSLYDRGKRPGGRASTRIDRRHGKKFQFDHGATYVRPKSEQFKALLEEVQILPNWPARFAEFDHDKGFSVQAAAHDVYVGEPGMGYLLQALLEGGGIEAAFGKTVRLEKSKNPNAWQVIDTSKGVNLGTFDWIICSERYLSNELLGMPTVTTTGGALAVPSLVAMLALDESATKTVDELMPCDGVRIHNDYVLAWAALDSSKPGRNVQGGGSTWVLQSTVPFAEDLIREVTTANLPCSEADLLKAIKRECESPLYQAFLNVVAASGGKGGEELELNPPLYLKGHRWGRSFPAHFEAGTHLLDAEKRLVACGDYFEGTLAPAKVEGAVLSGLAAANALLEHLE